VIPAAVNLITFMFVFLPRYCILLSPQFMHAVRFKADVSSWQTSSISNASEAFFGAFSFNSDVSHWDVRNLVDLTKMVCCAQFDSLMIYINIYTHF
jgi:Mycoplasma protein of unknown function, DUF285